VIFELRNSMEQCETYKVSYPFIIKENHLEVCEKLSSSFLKALNKRLCYVKDIAQTDALQLYCEKFWKILTQVKYYKFTFQSQ